MSNWLEEEKETKKIKEAKDQEERKRKEENAIQITRFKDKISPFYSYVSKVKDEGFSINIGLKYDLIIIIENGSKVNYRHIKIEASSNNSFNISITGTFHHSGYTYDPPIVEEIRYSDHSFTRETRKEVYESYDYLKEICKRECEEEELARFLNNETNAIKIIGWLFDKTELDTRWLPGKIHEEIRYTKDIGKVKEEIYSKKIREIKGTIKGTISAIINGVILGGIIGSVIGYVIYSIFNSGIAMLWTIIICMAYMALHELANMKN